MAVTETSDAKFTKQQAEERVEASARGAADAGACCRVNQQSESRGPAAAGHRNVNKDICRMVKFYKLRRCPNKVDESDSLSGIDDAEVSGYLNTKEEVNYKRVLWEAMNKNYTQAKKRKRKTEVQKAVSVKKSAKITEKVQGRRPSARINYDALKLLDDELKQGSERDHVNKADSYGEGNENSPYGNISPAMLGSNESSYDEDEHDISYCRDNQTVDHHHDGEMYYENGGEHFDDEYFDF